MKVKVFIEFGDTIITEVVALDDYSRPTNAFQALEHVINKYKINEEDITEFFVKPQ